MVGWRGGLERGRAALQLQTWEKCLSHKRRVLQLQTWKKFARCIHSSHITQAKWKGALLRRVLCQWSVTAGPWSLHALHRASCASLRKMRALARWKCRYETALAAKCWDERARVHASSAVKSTPSAETTLTAYRWRGWRVWHLRRGGWRAAVTSLLRTALYRVFPRWKSRMKRLSHAMERALLLRARVCKLHEYFGTLRNHSLILSSQAALTARGAFRACGGGLRKWWVYAVEAKVTASLIARAGLQCCEKSVSVAFRLWSGFCRAFRQLQALGETGASTRILKERRGAFRMWVVFSEGMERRRVGVLLHVHNCLHHSFLELREHARGNLLLRTIRVEASRTSTCRRVEAVMMRWWRASKRTSDRVIRMMRAGMFHVYSSLSNGLAAFRHHAQMRLQLRFCWLACPPLLLGPAMRKWKLVLTSPLLPQPDVRPPTADCFRKWAAYETPASVTPLARSHAWVVRSRWVVGRWRELGLLQRRRSAQNRAVWEACAHLAAEGETPTASLPFHGGLVERFHVQAVIERGVERLATLNSLRQTVSDWHTYARLRSRFITHRRKRYLRMGFFRLHWHRRDCNLITPDWRHVVLSAALVRWRAQSEIASRLRDLKRYLFASRLFRVVTLWQSLSVLNNQVAQIARELHLRKFFLRLRDIFRAGRLAQQMQAMLEAKLHTSFVLQMRQTMSLWHAFLWFERRVVTHRRRFNLRSGLFRLRCYRRECDFSSPDWRDAARYAGLVTWRAQTEIESHLRALVRTFLPSRLFQTVSRWRAHIVMMKRSAQIRGKFDRRRGFLRLCDFICVSLLYREVHTVLDQSFHTNSLRRTISRWQAYTRFQQRIDTHRWRYNIPSAFLRLRHFRQDCDLHSSDWRNAARHEGLLRWRAQTEIESRMRDLGTPILHSRLFRIVSRWQAVSILTKHLSRIARQLDLRRGFRCLLHLLDLAALVSCGRRRALHSGLARWLSACFDSTRLLGLRQALLHVRASSYLAEKLTLWVQWSHASTKGFIVMRAAECSALRNWRVTAFIRLAAAAKEGLNLATAKCMLHSRCLARGLGRFRQEERRGRFHSDYFVRGRVFRVASCFRLLLARLVRVSLLERTQCSIRRTFRRFQQRLGAGILHARRCIWCGELRRVACKRGGFRSLRWEAVRSELLLAQAARCWELRAVASCISLLLTSGMRSRRVEMAISQPTFSSFPVALRCDLADGSTSSASGDERVSNAWSIRPPSPPL
ncbi:MAG: hypothetical protein SGPRY_005100 [Prymnesium sp.]